MTDQQLLDRVSLDPRVVGGKPTIKGTRLTVEYMLNLLAHGAIMEEILGGQLRRAARRERVAEAIPGE